MNFSSITFLFYFLPAVVTVYFLCRGRTARNAILLGASLLFYAWGEGIFLLLLLGSIAFNHVIVHRLNASQTSRKSWLAGGIAANLGFLIIFKYTGLITQTLAPFGVPYIETHLPLGISFFTFQAMSMVVDVYRGAKPSSSMLKTGLFISMFPQLVAGPIVRFNEIRDQIDRRDESFDRFADGVKIFIFGLSQKVLLADVLSGPADIAFGADPVTLTAGAAWLGLICFSLQIYYDFAGYSNMAIGLGRFFGFELPRNFDYPYSSKSFREFWRRWHMTLSRWFRDYLYIPLGGSRIGEVATYRNLLIVFILCGLWHGAAWTFLLWGLWHGAFLIAERICPKLPLPKFLVGPVGMLYVCIFVSLGWVLFRAENLPHALGYWQALSGFGGVQDPTNVELSGSSLIVFLVAILLAWDGSEKLWEGTKDRIGKSSGIVKDGLIPMAAWGMPIALYGLCFIFMASETHKPFLYFRF